MSTTETTIATIHHLNSASPLACDDAAGLIATYFSAPHAVRETIATTAHGPVRYAACGLVMATISPLERDLNRLVSNLWAACAQAQADGFDSDLVRELRELTDTGRLHYNYDDMRELRSLAGLIGDELDNLLYADDPTIPADAVNYIDMLASELMSCARQIGSMIVLSEELVA